MVIGNVALHEVLQRLSSTMGINGASTLVVVHDSTPLDHDGGQGVRTNGGPTMGGGIPDPVALEQRNVVILVVEDTEKFNVERLCENRAKEGGIDILKAENWLDSTETSFLALQMPHHQKLG